MATTTALPDEEQLQQDGGNWYSSGSIRPFFAVISVLAVLAILSCVLGRICRNRRRQLSLSTTPPLHCVKQKGCRGWMRRWWLVEGGNEVVPGAGDKAAAVAAGQEGFLVTMITWHRSFQYRKTATLMLAPKNKLQDDAPMVEDVKKEEEHDDDDLDDFEDDESNQGDAD